MNFVNNLQYTINHFAKLALMPGWIDEARHSVMKLEKEHPDVYAGLGAAVASRIAYLKEQAKNGGSHENSV